MPRITFIRPDGTERLLEAMVGQSVMELATANGLSEIVADCGRSCACATCHVIVDEAWAGRLEPIETMEAEMIAFVADPQPTSRLSCQLQITEDFDGLILHLPSRQV